MIEKAPEQLGLAMPTRDWLLIDGTIDNLRAVSIEDASLVQRCGAVREAGWRDIPDWPTILEGLESWPAEGQVSEVRLPRTEWALVIEALEDVEADLSLAEDTGLQPEERELHAEIAARSVAIAADLRKRIGQ